MGILKSIDESCDLRYENTAVQRSGNEVISYPGKTNYLHRIWLQTYGKKFPKLSLCGWHNRVNSDRNGYPNYGYWKRGISCFACVFRVIVDHKNSILQIVRPYQRKKHSDNVVPRNESRELVNRNDEPVQQQTPCTIINMQPASTPRERTIELPKSRRQRSRNTSGRHPRSSSERSYPNRRHQVE